MSHPSKDKHVQWKGGRSISKRHGGVLLSDSLRGGFAQLEHRNVAERALGRKLERTHPVHHHDKNRQNNCNTNLVICENASYHALLHYRTRVYLAGGDPNTQKFCQQCKVLFLKRDFARNKSAHDGLSGVCKACRQLWNQKRYQCVRVEPLAELI